MIIYVMFCNNFQSVDHCDEYLIEYLFWYILFIYNVSFTVFTNYSVYFHAF